MRIGLAGAGRIGTFHAKTLDKLPHIEELVVADADPGRARALVERLGGATAVDSVGDLFDRSLDGLVVATATDAHAGLVARAAAAGLPVFCEKPVAADIPGTLQVMAEVRRSGIPVQVGFQRRFDTGHLQAREAVASGRLGWVHTLRSCTLDPAPPPRDYLPHSGGLFRDCVIHDVDAIRFVTGQNVTAVTAMGANKGDPCFREFGDVDTAAAVFVLDDGTLALSCASRYNGAGYDVRLEVLGSRQSVVAGLNGRTPLTPLGTGAITGGTPPPEPVRPRLSGRAATAVAETGTSVTTGTMAEPGSVPAYSGFMERFADAYTAELETFTELAAGRIANPCPPEEALEAFYVAEACERSRREGRAVAIKEVRS